MRHAFVAAVLVLGPGCDSGMIGATDGDAGNGTGDGRPRIDARIRIDAAPATADGAPATGNPATGPGGGSNLTCEGSSFPPNSTFYQDIFDAPADAESPTIMGHLDDIGWADPPARQDLGIDFSFEINCDHDGTV